MEGRARVCVLESACMACAPRHKPVNLATTAAQKAQLWCSVSVRATCAAPQESHCLCCSSGGCRCRRLQPALPTAHLVSSADAAGPRSQTAAGQVLHGPDHSAGVRACCPGSPARPAQLCWCWPCRLQAQVSVITCKRASNFAMAWLHLCRKGRQRAGAAAQSIL